MNLDSDVHPIVSAIVSVYKAERFIRGCLEDLIDQTLFHAGQLEIIVVNSNSPENEDAIISEYVASYPSRIKYIRTEERETIYQAWNRGVQLASARYLTNANADDRHRSDALEVMANCLDAHPDIALVYADCDVTTVENSCFGKAPVIAHFKWPDFQPVHLFQICHIGPQPMWRRSLHEHHGLFDATYRSAGDYEFWLRLASRGEQFYHIPECLGLYLQSPGGVEHANQRLSWDESNRARVTHWPSNRGERPQPAGNYLIPVHFQTRPDSTPLVSIIMPTRNRPEFLARAIKSVLCQTYRYFEIVVVNDGGIDVQELIDHFNAEGNIQYINLKNRIERSSVRNLAIKAAKGFYIAYLDDDDRYFPEHLEILVKHAQESGCRTVYSDAYRAQLSTATGLPDETTRDVPYSLDFDQVRIYVENFIPILCLMHERSCLDESGMFDEQLSRLEDWDLWIRLSQVSGFHHIPRATCEFTWHSGGSTQTLDNAPLFLAAYKAICKKHASISQQNASIRVWQQSNIYNKTCHTFEYVKQELFPQFIHHQSVNTPAIPDKTAYSFLERGIGADRIKSTIFWIKSLAHDQADSSEYWLHKALEADIENHPARLQLAALLVRQQRYCEATLQLEKIHEYNPVDIPTISMLTDLYMYKTDDTNRAVQMLDKGLWLFPDDRTLLAQLNKIQGI